MPNHLAAALRVSLIGSLAILSGCGYAGTPPTDKSGSTAPTITQQPVSQSVVLGQSSTFSVGATGSAPLAYQWFTNGTATSGANASTYTLPQVAKSQDQSAIYVIVSNSKGSVTSATAKLTVTDAATLPTITMQPMNQTVTVGQSATFTVAATGSGPLTYQWYYLGQPIVTARSTSFTVGGSSTSLTGASVYVTVGNSAGVVTSNKVTITVLPAAGTPPTITTQPTNQTVNAGTTAAFSVSATGSNPLTYSWFLNGAAAGTNSSTYTISGTTTGQNGATVYVKVTNSAGSVTSATAKLAVTSAAVPPTITVQPANLTVAAGQSATFTVTATGTAPLAYQWIYGGAPVLGANGSSFTFENASASENGAKVYVKVGNSVGSVTSTTATLTVTQAQPSSVNVLTYHNDAGRTGQNLQETILTTTNVNSNAFGKVAFLNADGLVDAEPLYVSGVSIGGATHNVVYVVTENDSAYAYDADSLTQLWKVSALGSNETPSDNRGCSQVTPQIGITSTPVIDRSAGAHGTMYLAAMSKDSEGHYYQRIHALDLATGAELNGGPTTVQATFTLGKSTTTFDPANYKERAALLLLNGTIYTTWASHCDAGQYTGWVMGYSESTLQQTSVLDITPNGGDGAIWMAGDGPASDSSGNIYFLVANGTFDDTLNTNGFPEHGDYGNAFLKIATGTNSLSVADYFTMSNTDSESQADQDLGSGGELLLPDLQDAQSNTWHLAVGAGKDGHIYLANRDMMGKFNTHNDSGIYQEISSGGLGGGVWSSPAYWNNTLYYGAVNDTLRAFTITNAKIVTPAATQSPEGFGYPGATPSISANGTSNGIVWAIQNNGTGVLRAYDATNLGIELYNSGQAAKNRDTFTDNKFVTPMIANGKVYVGTPTGVQVFGLLQ